MMGALLRGLGAVIALAAFVGGFMLVMFGLAVAIGVVFGVSADAAVALAGVTILAVAAFVMGALS